MVTKMPITTITTTMDDEFQPRLKADYYSMPFSEYYPEQENAIREILHSKESIILLQAPTGSGKSAIVVTVGRNIASIRTVILTRTKALQHQYRDLLNFYSAEGMSSYQCPLDPEHSAEEVFCQVDHCPHKMCEYKYNKGWSEILPEIVTNYSWYLSHPAHSELLVLDEAHYANDIVTDFMTTTFTDYDFKVMNTTKEEAEEHITTLFESKIKGIGRLLFSARKRKQNKFASYLADLSNRLKKLSMVTNSCPYEIVSGRWLQIIPKDDAGLIDTFLLDTASTSIMMSATILDPVVFMKEKGLGHLPYTYIELPNIIPAEQRPIFYYPTTKVGHQRTNYKKLVNRIDEILQFHSNQKGIIHTSNFILAKQIQQMSSYSSSRLMVQTKETDRTELISKFMSTSESKVLVSPSITTGVDLPDDMARFAIFAKVPFPNLANKRVREKMNTSKWYEWTTVCELVQGSGRTIRHKEDYGVTYILDSNFGWFYNQNKNTFPRWWRDALKR